MSHNAPAQGLLQVHSHRLDDALNATVDACDEQFETLLHGVTAEGAAVVTTEVVSAVAGAEEVDGIVVDGCCAVAVGGSAVVRSAVEGSAVVRSAVEGSAVVSSAVEGSAVVSSAVEGSAVVAITVVGSVVVG